MFPRKMRGEAGNKARTQQLFWILCGVIPSFFIQFGLEPSLAMVQILLDPLVLLWVFTG